MKIPKEIIEFLNKSEIKEIINTFQGKHYWFLFTVETKIAQNNIVTTTTSEASAVIESYHPFLAMEVLNKINHNIRYYLKNYKEISKEEFDLFRILNPIESEGNK